MEYERGRQQGFQELYYANGTEMRDKGVTDIIKIGIAFFGKEAEVEVGWYARLRSGSKKLGSIFELDTEKIEKFILKPYEDMIKRRGEPNDN